jgi:hypothetical protein
MAGSRAAALTTGVRISLRIESMTLSMLACSITFSALMFAWISTSGLRRSGSVGVIPRAASIAAS